MSLPLTTAPELEAHLRGLGLSHGQDIVVHSRLIAFGRIEGGVATVYDVLRSVVGPQATIGVPTYTFHLREDQPFEPDVTPSSETGVLSEFVRRLPGATRSRCPIHSHAAVGPGAALLTSVTGEASMGPGSDFEALRHAGFRLLLLGCDFHEGATFVHHVEALVGVPYRRWRSLPRRIVVDGRARDIAVRYFSRISDDWIEDHRKVQDAMEAAGLVQSAACPFGRSYLASLADIECVGTDMLNADPYGVVRAAGGLSRE